MEEEAREILNLAVVGKRGIEPNLAESIRRRFADIGGVELEFEPREAMGQPPSFDQ